MDHAPRRVAEAPVHRRENGLDFGFGLRGDVIGVVRIPHVWVRRVGYDAAMRRREDAGAKPPLPPIGLGDEARDGVHERQSSRRTFGDQQCQ